MSNPARPSLPRTVILLGWVSFFADVSSEMIYPLLPLFIVAALGASATSLGWIEGVAAAVVAVMTALAGWRSDVRRRRLPFVHWGYGLPVLGKSILVLARTWPLVLLGRAVDRFGKGLRGSPRDALIAEAVDAPLRGRAFGLHRTMDTAGAFTGVLLAAGLLYWLNHAGPHSSPPNTAPESARPFRIIFAISAALGLISLAITFLVREGREPAVPTRGAQPPTLDAPDSDTPNSPPDTPHSILGLPNAYWLAMLILLVFAIANSSDTFLLLRASNAGLTPWAVVLAYALYNLTSMLTSYPAGALSDRIGRWRIIAIGWLLYAAVYAGFALTNAAAVWPLFACYGVYIGLTEGIGKALLADLSPRGRRGTAIGLFYMASGFTSLSSSVIAGLLWDRVGPAAPFWFGAAAALLAAGLIPLLAPASKRGPGAAAR